MTRSARSVENYKWMNYILIVLENYVDTASIFCVLCINKLVMWGNKWIFLQGYSILGKGESHVVNKWLWSDIWPWCICFVLETE